MSEPSTLAGSSRHRPPAAEPAHILLVEDNPGDVDLAREALAEGGIGSQMSVVSDGVEALAFLRRQGRYAAACRPALVLLDLDLPRKDGRAVLAEVKCDPSLCTIPVVVLTSSGAERDVARAYELHANCFLTKPVDLDHFISLVQAVVDFWLRVAQLPTAS